AVLRTMGHLQVLSFMGEGLAFRTPPAFQAAASAGDWAALDWLSGGGAEWAKHFSKRLSRGDGPPPPPPPRIQSFTGGSEQYLLDTGLLSSTPYLSSMSSSSGANKATSAAVQTPSLVWNYTSAADTRADVEDAWRRLGSTIVLTGVLVGAALLVHGCAAIAPSTSRLSRLTGYSLHVVWPKPLLVVLTLTIPPLLFAACGALSHEAASGSGASVSVGAGAVVFVALSCFAALGVLTWLAIVVLRAAPSKLVATTATTSLCPSGQPMQPEPPTAAACGPPGDPQPPQPPVNADDGASEPPGCIAPLHAASSRQPPPSANPGLHPSDASRPPPDSGPPNLPNQLFTARSVAPPTAASGPPMGPRLLAAAPLQLMDVDDADAKSVQPRHGTPPLPEPQLMPAAPRRPQPTRTSQQPQMPSPPWPPLLPPPAPPPPPVSLLLPYGATSGANGGNAANDGVAAGVGLVASGRQANVREDVSFT
ncbi:hypothetical protein Agub_g15340, partial [Astrephomene gubernaculifera]